MEDIDGIYRWVGPSLNENPVKTSYPGLLVQFKVRGKSQNNNLCLFTIGCKVLVFNGDKIPFIGEIVELYHDKVKKKMLTKLRWFYRYQDAKAHHRFTYLPLDNEIFYSNHCDVNEVSVLKSPCYVVFLPEKEPPPLSGRCYQNTYICRYELTFPGVSCFENAKIKFELERDFNLFPLQLQHLLLSDRKYWSLVESLAESSKISYQFLPSGERINKVDSTEVVPEKNDKELKLDTTANGNENSCFSTSVSDKKEILFDNTMDEDLYFSSEFPPTKLTRVRPFDSDDIEESNNVELMNTAVRNDDRDTSKDSIISGTLMNEYSTKANSQCFILQKCEETTEHINCPDDFHPTDSSFRTKLAISQPSASLDEDSDINYFFDEDLHQSKDSLPSLLPSRPFDSNSPKTDLSPTTYLSTPNKSSTHLKFIRTNSTNSSLLDSDELDYFEVADDNNEQYYVKSAANNIPPCLPFFLSKDVESDALWKPCEAIYLYGVDISYALELLIQPIVQSVLLSSLKQLQHASGTDSNRLIVDGSLAMLTGVDVLGLFYEILYQQLPNSNIFELEPVLPHLLDELKSRLTPFVTIWSIQEQDRLYTLCRTPERSSHIISLPLRRAQQKLAGKSRKEIVDFFSKYVDNGRYLDIVLNHEGFAYDLIHSDLTLEDARALSYCDEHIYTNNKKYGSHGNDPSSSQMYSLEDSICSQEEERWRRTIYWAKWDKQENAALSQEDLYGFELRVVDSMITQLLTGAKKNTFTSSEPRMLPYLTMAEYHETSVNTKDEVKSNSEDNEKLCHSFFIRIAAIIDEVSFHQFCCTLLLWQRTCITIGVMVVRVSHIIANAVIEDDVLKSIPVKDFLGRYHLIRSLKKDLYLQFKALISSANIQRFQLPYFEL